MLSMLGRFVGTEGNLSSAKLHSNNVSLSADFYNRETYDNATAADTNIFKMMDVIANYSNSSVLEESNFNLTALGSDDSALTILLNSDVDEASFNRVSSSIFDSLKRAGLQPSPWTVVISVQGNPELSSVVFGSPSIH